MAHFHACTSTAGVGLAQLSHPHVVGVIDAGEDENRPYIVFEYVEGETLKERIRRVGRLPIPEAVAYAIEIARALGAAHARQIVHRDVKPQNVMIDDEGSAKVTDFGIARTLDEDGLTADGRVLGTTDYVSPEQALGQRVNGQSDLYSLGIVLFEMLTGDVPFKGDNQVAVAMKHVREDLPDVRVLRPEISAALAAVVDTATAKRPEQRYANDQEMIADLEDVLAIEAARAGGATGQVTTVLRTLPRHTRRRVPFSILHRRLLAPLALALVACLVGVGIWVAAASHHGTASNPQHRTVGISHGTLINLCQNCASAYNPDAPAGQNSQNNTSAGLAIDGSLSTAWPTQQYYTGSLNKAGVGLYVKVGGGTTASRLILDTETPGFAASIYATNTAPVATSFSASHWVELASVSSVSTNQTFQLRHSNTRFTYYLVWITKLPPNKMSASLNELSLYS